MANNPEDPIGQSSKTAESGSGLVSRPVRGRARGFGRREAGEAGRGRARGRARRRGDADRPGQRRSDGVPGVLVHPVFAPVLRPPAKYLPGAPASYVNTGYYGSLPDFSSLEYFNIINSYIIDYFAYLPELETQTACRHFVIRSATDHKPLCRISISHPGNAKMTNLTGTVTLCSADNMFAIKKCTQVAAGQEKLGSVTCESILGSDNRIWGCRRVINDQKGRQHHLIANSLIMVHIRSFPNYKRFLVQFYPTDCKLIFKVLCLIYATKVRKFFDNELIDTSHVQLRESPTELLNILSVKDSNVNAKLPAMARFETPALNPDLSGISKLSRIQIMLAAINNSQSTTYYYIKNTSKAKILLTGELNSFYPCTSITVRTLPGSDNLFLAQRYFRNKRIARVYMFTSAIGHIYLERDEITYSQKPPNEPESVTGTLSYQDTNQKVWNFNSVGSPANIPSAVIRVNSDNTVSMEISRTTRLVWKALYLSFALLRVTELLEQKYESLKLPTCTDITKLANDYNQTL